MNLHRIASGMIRAVNPMIPVTLRESIGSGAPDARGVREPLYATPGRFMGSIDGTTLTVLTAEVGALKTGQTIDGDGIASGTTIVSVVDGDGGPGVYRVSNEQTVGLVLITTTMPLSAQVQPMTARDLQMLDAVNLGGEKVKMYLFGSTHAVQRVGRGKGGDLVDIAAGSVHDGTWLVNQVLEQWPAWVCAAVTLQNGA